MKRTLSAVMTACMLLGMMGGARISAAPVWDDPPAGVAQGINSSLIDIELTGFKGSRIEYMKIPLQEPIEPDKYDYVMDVDMKQFPTADKCFYVKPVAYDPNATFIINGTPCDFNVPYRFDIPSVAFSGDMQVAVCTIVVTSGDGQNQSTYTLTARSQDLYDRVKVTVLEEDLPNKRGVYQITSIDGFTTSEDASLFIGSDRALLFDALNQGGNGSRRGGDLKNTIYDILTTKFGDDEQYPLPDIASRVYSSHLTQPSIGIPSGQSALNDIKISSFKGGRLEPYRIELDEPVDVMTWQKRDFTATMDWGSRTSNVVYITPETFSARDGALMMFR
ncbi:MAG: cadherin-like beta sandwich domain-containing protein, partial [Oscillospiraceae bacterium]|nr:cadherin-like beta sandwich domain-containing protein [Oscillospiraceae bacterium]